MTDFLCQLTAFIIADIAGWGADQTTCAVFFHVFGHIQTNQGVFCPEHCFRQRFRKLCFADSSRAQEQEGTDWTVWILQTGTCASDGASHRTDRLGLPNDAFMQHFFQPHQTIAFLLLHLVDRNPGPQSHDFSYIIFGYFQVVVRDCLGLLFHHFLEFLLLRHFTFADAGSFIKILVQDRFFFVFRQLRNFHLQFSDRCIPVCDIQTDFRGRFINQINRFIRQSSGSDVAHR